MGNTLSYPIRSKRLVRKGSQYYRVGIASMCGYRIGMEDYECSLIDISEHPDMGIFGIFDGHGGKHASNFIRTKLPERIIEQATPTQDFSKLIKVFEGVDADLLSLPPPHCDHGSAACVAIVEPVTDKPATYNITICNVGDSRCLVIDPAGKMIYHTIDHKPENYTETQRICKAGMHVTGNRIYKNDVVVVQ